MIIITSHLNLDFDGFAAAHLLKLLFPDSVMVFPGAKEGKLRAFEERHSLALPPDISVSRLKEVENVDGLVVADTSSLHRIGILAQLVNQLPADAIHVFDHHESGDDPIVTPNRTVRPVGATTSVVVGQLRDMGIAIPETLATLGVMGIYEDTDFLSFPGTTAEDADAVAHLLRCGADLNEVATALKHPLNARQIELFNQMIPLLERHTVQGRQVAMVQFVSDRFEPDISSVVHRIMELENLRLFFCMVQMDNKTFLIARNLYSDLDLKSLLSDLKEGGGHRNVYTAIFRNQTVFEVRQLLDGILGGLPSAVRALNVAQPPVQILGPDTIVADIFELMNRLRVNSLPVRNPETDELYGAVMRQDVDYAIVHDLGHLPAASIMHAEVETVDATADIQDVRDLFMNSNAKLVFVRDENGRQTGIITRTAAFKQAILISDTKLKQVSYGERMKRLLPPGLMDIVKTASRVADRMGIDIYLVGGFVRDLLLRRSNEDLDMVASTDGIRFAQELAVEMGARCVPHEKFHTAVLVLPDGQRLDVATSRFEYYRTPGALPEVTSAHVFHDLYRRDFTINAMALRISGKKFGELVDYFGGRRDLKEGMIRVLHSLSFVDDPTRVLRAIRFKHRFKLRIGRTTMSLMKAAVEMDLYDRISGFRFQKEIRLLFSEPNASLILEDLEYYGGLRFFHPQLTLDPFTRDLSTAVDSVVAWHRLQFDERVAYWLIYLMAILVHANVKQKRHVCRKLVLRKKYSRQIMRFRGFLRGLEILFDRTGDNIKPSRIFRAMANIDPEMQMFALAYFDEERIKRAISLYLTRYVSFPFHVSGSDLIQSGVPEGPEIRDLLEEIRSCCLDEHVEEREEQLKIMQRIIGERN